jgi:hypothetical protein
LLFSTSPPSPWEGEGEISKEGRQPLLDAPTIIGRIRERASLFSDTRLIDAVGDTVLEYNLIAPEKRWPIVRKDDTE